MSVRAAYLAYGEAEEREQMDWNPESSRRARGFPVYAAIRSLGRSGIRAMIERCCEHARRFAEELEGLGAEILNDVVLNQVLLRFESNAATDEVVRRVQASGEAWMGGTTWAGRKAIRISVSNWQTTETDVERMVEAFRAAIAAPAAAR
jgi:glutamate/tyrosine decarboxylase-like PLP-dependent enzyme